MPRVASGLALAAAACAAPPDVVSPAPADAGADLPPPGEYEDDMVPLGLYDGPRFVEIEDVVVDGATVFICTNVQGLLVYDASDPAAPTELGRAIFSAGSLQYPRCSRLAVDGTTVYATNPGDEIQPTPFLAAIDVGDPTDPAERAVAVLDAPPEGLTAAGGRVFVAAHEAGVRIFDAELAPAGEIVGPQNAWSVAIEGDTAYVADASGLLVYDVAAEPVPMGSLALAGTPRELAVGEGRAAIPAGAGGVHVVDVADPAAPALIATLPTPGSALDVWLDGSFAYVAAWNDLRVFDLDALALDATETIVNEAAYSRVLSVAARGGVVYAGEWSGLYTLAFRPGVRAPDLWLSDRFVRFSAGPGEVDAFALLLRNEGDARLRVTDLASRHAAFTVDATDLAIEPGETAVVEIVFAPQSAAKVDSALDLVSDDPDEARAIVRLVANRPGVDVGDEAPDFDLFDLDGARHRLSYYRGSPVLIAYFATF